MPNALESRIAGYGIGTLASLLGSMDKLAAERPAGLTAPERMVYAALADRLTALWGIDELLDAVFMDDAFTGTYFEAMKIAREQLVLSRRT